MNQRLNGSNAHIQLMCNLIVRRKLLAVERVKEVYQCLECGGSPFSRVFEAQAFPCLAEQGNRPPGIEDLLRRQSLDGLFPSIAILGVLYIQHIQIDKLDMRSSFEAKRRTHFVGEIVPQRCQQERSELTILLVHSREGFVLKQIEKKALGQVLRIFGGMAATPHKRVKRIPVESTQLGERFLIAGRLALRRKQHNVPPSGAKSVNATFSRTLVQVQL